MSDFGSPGAGDATAKIEREVSKLADEHNRELLRLANVLNRPIGSVVDIPKEDQIADWLWKQGEGAQQLVTELQQRASVVGERRARLELYEWDAAMRKMVSNGSE